MRLGIAFLLLFFVTPACITYALPMGLLTTPLNSSPYNASTAIDGTTVVLTAPACPMYVSGGCMKGIDPGVDDVGLQRWSYVISVVNGNATRCAFTFSLPTNENAQQWTLVATSNCRN